DVPDSEDRVVVKPIEATPLPFVVAVIEPRYVFALPCRRAARRREKLDAVRRVGRGRERAGYLHRRGGELLRRGEDRRRLIIVGIRSLGQNDALPGVAVDGVGQDAVVIAGDNYDAAGVIEGDDVAHARAGAADHIAGRAED